MFPGCFSNIYPAVAGGNDRSHSNSLSESVQLPSPPAGYYFAGFAGFGGAGLANLAASIVTFCWISLIS